MEGQYNLRSPAVKRLMKEAQELREPTEQYYAHPIEDNLFEWHFTIRGPVETDFEGGIYHGRIILPPEYPMKPPSIMLLTSNGRFETNKKICLSISGYHPESWQPSWSIRTALLAIIGFMPTHGNGAIGSLDYTEEERKKLAKRSQEFNCPHCGCVKNILKPVTDASKATNQEARELAAQINFQGEKEKNDKKENKIEGAATTSANSSASAPTQPSPESSTPGNPFTQIPQLPGFPLPQGFPMPPGGASFMPPTFPFGMMRPPNSTQAPFFWPPQFPPMPAAAGSQSAAGNRPAMPPMPMWPGFNPLMMQRMMGARSQLLASATVSQQQVPGASPATPAVSTTTTTSAVPAQSQTTCNNAQASQPRGSTPVKSRAPSNPSSSTPSTTKPTTVGSQPDAQSVKTSTATASASSSRATPNASGSTCSPKATVVSTSAPAATTSTTQSSASLKTQVTQQSTTTTTTTTATSNEGLRQRNLGGQQQQLPQQARFARTSQPAELSNHRVQGENSCVLFIMFMLALGIAILLIRRLYMFLPKASGFE